MSEEQNQNVNAPGAAPAPQAAPKPGGTSFVKILLGVLAGGCLLVVLVVVVSCGLFGAGLKKAKEKAAREEKRLAELPVSELAWDEIEKKFGPASGTTALQKQEAWKDYKGRKVRWTGTVLAVSQVLGTHTLQVRMNPGAKLRSLVVSDAFVALKAGEDQKARALALAPQQQVTFVAVLDRQNVKLGRRVALVTLKSGEIVE